MLPEPPKIPEQFKAWRFILVKAHDKKAFEKDWQTTANYGFDDPKLLSHLREGGNYGILPQTDHIIIETDTPELEALVEKNFPLTFTQRSPGHRTKQFFYDGRASQTWPLFDKSRGKEKQNVGHVKWGGSYVVGPGSTHPNNGKYEVVDDRLIAQITENQILEVLAPFFAQRARQFEVKEARKQGVDNFSIQDLLVGLDLKRVGDDYQGPHPIHGSTTGTNFHISSSKNVWHCFRCCTGGGAWQLLAVLEGIIDCSDSVPGGLRGESFKQTVEKAVEMGLVKAPEKKDVEEWKTYTPTDYDSEEVLYINVRSMFETYWDAPDPRYYDVLTSIVFLTYRIQQFKTTPYPFLYGPKASGKTRALELLKALAFHPILASSVSPASLYQAIEQYHPTFLIDETDKWGLRGGTVSEETQEVLKVLNSGYRRGQYVLRANREGGPLKHYDTFGVKVIAGTETFHETLMDRCIPLIMQENTKDIPIELPEPKLEALRSQLESYYQKHSTAKEEFDVDPEDLKMKIGNNRVTELYYPLYIVCPIPKSRDSLLSLAIEGVHSRKENSRLSELGQVAETILSLFLLKDGLPEFLLVEEIVNFHSDFPSQTKDRNKWMGHKLRKLGFEGQRIGHGGVKGIILDYERLERLDRQFYIHFITPNPYETTPSTPSTPAKGISPLNGVIGVVGGVLEGLGGGA